MAENKPAPSEQPTPSRRPWWRRKRVYGLALLVGLVGWYMAPLLHPHWEQDRCEFGTGSTALYERMQKETRVYLAEHGKVRFAEFSKDARRVFSLALKKQLADFTNDRATLREQFAASHGLLRAYGMEFDRSWPREVAALKGGEVSLSLSYLIYLPKLNMFCVGCYIFRTARYTVGFRRVNRRYTVHESYAGLKIFYPSIKAQLPFQYGRKYQTCPLVLDIGNK